jgi:hypothetical protein
MTKTPKRPHDVSQLAKMMVDMSTMDENELAALRVKLKLQEQKAEAGPKEDQAVERKHL